MLLATKHAEQRLLERSISPETIEILSLYGIDLFQEGHSVVTILSKEGRAILKRVRRDLEAVMKSDPVVKVESSGGWLITSYHQNRKSKYKYS